MTKDLYQFTKEIYDALSDKKNRGLWENIMMKKAGELVKQYESKN